jgi:hypothetical protein
VLIATRSFCRFYVDVFKVLHVFVLTGTAVLTIDPEAQVSGCMPEPSTLLY